MIILELKVSFEMSDTVIQDQDEVDCIEEMHPLYDLYKAHNINGMINFSQMANICRIARITVIDSHIQSVMEKHCPRYKRPKTPNKVIIL